MFSEICSIYSDALDNTGRYVDRETGECIRQMSIRDFCLTDRWKPYVQHLRAMREQYGSEAKKMDEYIQTKKQLPGATLSGLFELRDDICTRHDGSTFIAPVSRRETHLQQHTGWLAIDIDLGDNLNLSNFDNIRHVCRFRPEVGLLMRSCSGTGYFGLVRLAYPDQHKAQFQALLREYADIGVRLDRQCGNIGRVRFASWDDPDHIYINEKVRPYTGLHTDTADIGTPKPLTYHADRPTYRPPSSGPSNFWDTPEATDRLIELAVQALVDGHFNITESYEEWVKVGWSLKDHPSGEQLFHQLSSLSSKYKPQQTAVKWHQLGHSKTVTGAYLMNKCKIAIGEDAYRALCRQVWEELRGNRR